MSKLSIFTSIVFLFACGGDKDQDTSVISDDVTYHKDIAPILSENCSGCHKVGGLNPDILFDDAESAIMFAPVINNAVQQMTMPPFYAVETDECPNPWGFSHDPRLSDEEKALIQAWTDAGAPEGDPENASPLVSSNVSDLTDANATYYPEGYYTTSPVGSVKDEFVCFSIDPELDEVGWMEALQILPDDPEVVHHVLVAIDHDGESADLVDSDGVYDCFGGFGVNATLIGGWVPGSAPIRQPIHSAIRVGAESRIVLQMHYHLIEEARPDKTGLAVRWAEKTPVRPAYINLHGNLSEQYGDGSGLQPGPNDNGQPEFLIPAGATDHVELMRLDIFDSLVEDYEVFMVGNHMHYVGRDMRAWLEKSDGDDECLLHTPSWDFDWQQLYTYDADAGNSPVVSPGDKLWLECRFDNSMDNPWAVAALEEYGYTEPVDVGLGEGSLDEMCLLVIGTVPSVKMSVDGQTHSGVSSVNVSSTDYAFTKDCEGPSGFKIDGNTVKGVSACGLDVLDFLYTVEISYTGTVNGNTASGDLSLHLLNMGTFTSTWTGNIDGDSLNVVFDFEPLIGEGRVRYQGDFNVTAN